MALETIYKTVNDNGEYDSIMYKLSFQQWKNRLFLYGSALLEIHRIERIQHYVI